MAGRTKTKLVGGVSIKPIEKPSSQKAKQIQPPKLSERARQQIRRAREARAKTEAEAHNIWMG